MPISMAVGVGPVPATTRRATSRFFQGSVALEFPTFRFACPPGLVAVVDRVWCRLSPASGPLGAYVVSELSVFFGSSLAVAPPTVPTRSFTDGRLLAQDPAPTPAAVLVHGTQVAALAVSDWRRTVDNVNGAMTQWEVDWVCGTGIPAESGFIEFQTSVLEQSVSFGLEWTEFLL